MQVLYALLGVRLAVNRKTVCNSVERPEFSIRVGQRGVASLVVPHNSVSRMSAMDRRLVADFHRRGLSVFSMWLVVLGSRTLLMLILRTVRLH